MNDKLIIVTLAILLMVNSAGVFWLLYERRKRIKKSNLLLEMVLNRRNEGSNE